MLIYWTLGAFAWMIPNRNKSKRVLNLLETAAPSLFQLNYKYFGGPHV